MSLCAGLGCGNEFVPRGSGVTIKRFCGRRCKDKAYDQTDARKATLKQSNVRYRQTDLGKATNKRYQKLYLQTDAGKTTQKRANKRWRKTEEGKKVRADAQRRHRRTEKSKERNARDQRRFSATEKGRAYNSRKRYKYRALKRDSFVENVDIRLLIEKQGGRCSLCGDPFVGSYPNPLAVSLDHTIPLSLGGKHSYMNCTATHLSCNSKKGAKLETKPDPSRLGVL